MVAERSGYDRAMLSSDSQAGSSLADVLPTLLSRVCGRDEIPGNAPTRGLKEASLDAVVLIVVDGLGWMNLKQSQGHARFLAQQPSKRIETVRPSTTGAALTTLLTGVLPGQHGLPGYRIRDVASGRFRSTLTDWEGFAPGSEWMRAPSLLKSAHEQGLNPVAIGRPAHAQSGLTAAILSGARYVSAASIADRFAQAASVLRAHETQLMYLYIDELDRAGHVYGWQSLEWLMALEEVDSQVRAFVATLPKRVGVVLTADHGMVDVPAHKHILMDSDPELLAGVSDIAGEPRFRYLYLAEPSVERASGLATAWRERLAKQSWVWTRQEAIDTGMFGPVDAVVAERMGDVVVAARGGAAFYTSEPGDEQSRRMIGQHGSITPDELGVPIIRLA